MIADDLARWIKAIRSRDTASLERMADGLGDIDAVDGLGNTALMVAARRANIGLLQRLLGLGADVDISNRDGTTALMCAAEAHDPGAIRVLLGAGARVDARDRRGLTALMGAALWAGEWSKYQDPETVQTLLDAGADVNARSGNGGSALIFAAENGASEIVQALLAAGADAGAVDDDGRSALAWAESKGRSEVVQLLIETARAESPLVEVECICILPDRFSRTLDPGPLGKMVQTCAVFAGSQVRRKYKIADDQFDVGCFTADQALGAGVVFTWRVPDSIRGDVANTTRSEWQELLAEIDRHGVEALLEAGARQSRGEGNR